MNGRIEHDAYYTPRWCVDLLVDQLRPLGFTDAMPVVDPCVGDGAILAALPNNPRYAVELRAECADTLRRAEIPHLIGDALDPAIRNQFGNHSVIANLPFALADDLIRIWALWRPFAAFLMRMNWCAGAAREQLFTTAPPAHIWVMPNRPAFVATCAPKCARWGWGALRSTCPTCGKRVKAATDNQEYAWIVWTRDHQINGGPTTFERLPLVSAQERRIAWDPETLTFRDRNEISTHK